MKTFLLTIGCILLGTSALYAQYPKLTVFGSMDTAMNIGMMPSIIADSTTVDTTVLQVYYRYDHIRNKKPACSVIRLQKGAEWIRQTDMCCFYSSIHNSAFERQDKDTDLDKLRKTSASFGSPSNLFLEMYMKRGDDILTVVCGDYFESSRPSVYRESRPVQDWKLQDGDSIVCGYLCHKAETQYRGRKWYVCYAPDIPVGEGPWKLRGLPGMILYAESDGIRFECIGVDPGRTPIRANRYEHLRDFRTRELYMRYERRCFEHPHAVFSEGGEAIILTKDAMGKSIELDESWTIPYDPIELE